MDSRRPCRGLLVAALLSGCNATDVGAPCNHGARELPTEPVVTFPALACNDLLCVYAATDEPSSEPCTRDLDCNRATSAGRPKFSCNAGRCQLDASYVLDRSMCSKRCETDADCSEVDGTACRTGFACARLHSLGELCCEKLCVCNDDLALATSHMLDEACEAGEAVGCCDKNPVPPACGP